MEDWLKPIEEAEEVKSPERALEEIGEESPLDLLTKSATFERRLSEKLGIDISELRALEKQGQLDRLLSVHYYAVAVKALERLAEAVALGEASPECLLKASTELAKTGLKLSGRDVSKHLILSEERLMELLSEAPEEQKE